MSDNTMLCCAAEDETPTQWARLAATATASGIERGDVELQMDGWGGFGGGAAAAPDAFAPSIAFTNLSFVADPPSGGGGARKTILNEVGSFIRFSSWSRLLSRRNS